MDYLKLAFSIDEESILLKKQSNGTYTCTLKYDARGPAFISTFTHVVNNVDSIHGITQGMMVDAKIGTEHHLQAKAGQKADFMVEGLLINTALEQTFLKEVTKGQPYAFAIRMVTSLYFNQKSNQTLTVGLRARVLLMLPISFLHQKRKVTH